jgi:hypothetical protein
VRLPANILNTDACREALQDYCGVLHAEGAFAGMTWPDAKQVAAAVSFDACTRDDAGFLQSRAANIHDRIDGMTWDDRDAAVRAFSIAAEALSVGGRQAIFPPRAGNEPRHQQHDRRYSLRAGEDLLHFSEQ